jgi:hypothetical protein
LDEPKKQLCEVVKVATKLNGLHKNNTKRVPPTRRTIAFIQINNCRTQIHASVLADLVGLKEYYQPLLEKRLADGIQEYVNEITADDPNRVYLNAAFIETFVQFIAELKKEKNHQNIKVCELVYKLVCLGQKMAWVFIKNEKEIMEWAYQQFVVNLAIHSLLADHQNSAYGKEKEEKIQRMAKIWPIGMEEEVTTRHAGEFIGMAYELDK